MKYINRCGTLCVSSDESGKFVSFMAAVMAMNAIQLFYAQFGYCVHSTISKGSRLVEVYIHFDSFNLPPMPSSYLYTKREITSKPLEASFAKPGERVRVVNYYFEF